MAGNSPLILMHGIGAGGSMFALLEAALKGRVPTVAWNMPGYEGASAEAELTFKRLAELIVETLDANGIEKGDLFGHSIGGMIAQEVAARYPNRVRSLILSGTTSFFGSRDGTFQKAFLEARLAPLDAGQTMPELAAEFVPQLLGDDPNPEAGPRAQAGLSALPQETYRAALKCLVTFNRRDDLAKIAVPTLLLAGQKDTNAPLKTMQKMAEIIPGAQLVELPGVGHLAPLERPADVAEAVVRFLDSLSGED